MNLYIFYDGRQIYVLSLTDTEVEMIYIILIGVSICSIFASQLRYLEV